MNHIHEDCPRIETDEYTDVVWRDEQTTCPMCLRLIYDLNTALDAERLAAAAAFKDEQDAAEEAERYWQSQEGAMDDDEPMTDADYFASDMAYDAARERRFFLPKRY